MRVADPTGREWVVGRRLLPWRPRPREVKGGDQFFDALGTDDVSGLAFGLLLVLLVPVVATLALFLGELLILLVLLPLLVFARTVLQRPWTVQVRPVATRDVTYVEQVVGWGAAGERIHQLATEIASGRHV